MASLSLSSRPFVALLFFSMFSAGWCRQYCDLANIVVTQKGTGNVVQGKSEFRVVVTNDCNCTQRSLSFLAEGFRSTEAVDPKIFRPDGYTFLLNNGQPLQSSETVTFNYAWDKQFDIIPVESQIACS